MLKRTITYEDYNGETVSEVYHFNLSKSELVELEVGYDAGFSETLQSIIETNDRKRIIAEFKKIILLAYGVKSEDGKRFIKNDELREHFTQTAAYNSLFIELATDDGKAADFINGIVPRDLTEQQDQDKPEVPKPSAAPTPPPLSPPST